MQQQQVGGPADDGYEHVTGAKLVDIGVVRRAGRIVHNHHGDQNRYNERDRLECGGIHDGDGD